jgi:uncharacterized protein (DUF427 family)
MSKNVMRAGADLSLQMEKTTNQHAHIPHIGKAGTHYILLRKSKVLVNAFWIYQNNFGRHPVHPVQWRTVVYI